MKQIGSQYYLMHKDIPVCLMDISDEGAISGVRKIEQNAAHFPLGGQMNNMKFHEWWKDRAIPKTRHGAKSALQKLGYSSTNSALVNNLALSLSDCYWIKPRGEDLTWKDTNLFANDFVDTFGEITLNQDSIIDIREKTKFNCATSQGELQKKWCIDENGKRYMVKGNYGNSYQQSINELFAAKLHEQQNFPQYTKYYPVRMNVDGDREGLGCMSYDFCSENIESISAWELLQTIKIRQNQSYYYPFKEVCLKLGMKEEEFQHFMDYQIMTDYLISNTDRHMNNISVMRNPDTLEILGFTPIYDSGNSMFYNVPYEELSAVRINEIKTHSFITKENKLLQYVKDRTCVDINKVDMDFSLYEMDIKERHIRIPKLQELYEKKCENILSFQRGRNLWENEQFRSFIKKPEEIKSFFSEPTEKDLEEFRHDEPEQDEFVMVDGVRSENIEDPAAGRDTSDQREDMDHDNDDRDEEDIGNLK